MKDRVHGIVDEYCGSAFPCQCWNSGVVSLPPFHNEHQVVLCTCYCAFRVSPGLRLRVRVMCCSGDGFAMSVCASVRLTSENWGR